MYWIGSAPMKPNSIQASAGWNDGTKASQPHTRMNRNEVRPAEAKSLTPTRRNALVMTPLIAKPTVMIAVVQSWMSARAALSAMPPTSRSHGPIHSVMQPMKASCCSASSGWMRQ